MKHAKQMIFLGILLLTCFALVSPASAQLNMLFTNSLSGYDSSNIWVTIMRGQTASNPMTDAPYLTYVDNTNSTPFIWTPVTNTVYQTDSNGYLTNTVTGVGQTYSQSISLSDIINNGGLRWYSNASSAQVVISYGSSIDSTYVTNQQVTYYASPADKSNNILTTNYNKLAFYYNAGMSANNPSDPSYQIPYQNFELTYTGTNSGDQGDITAINYMGSLVNISSYQSTNAIGTALQTVGYNANISAASLLQTFTNTIGSNGYGNTTLSSIVTNSAGNVVRVIGPSSFIGAGSSGLATYTNFSDYLGYVQTSTYSNTTLSNSSAYNTTAGGSSAGYQTNVNVIFVMTNQVTGTASNGFGLSATGNITLVYTSYFNGSNTGTTNQIISGIQFQVPASYTNSTNGVYPSQAAQFIYGASSGNANYFVQNSNYTALQSALASYVDGGNSNAMLDVTSQIAGEISQAFAFGLAGSTNLATNGMIIGSMPSGMWWQQSNGVTPFAGAETNSAYYSIYAALIAQASSNRVYGSPYSDRFGGSNSPLINDLVLNGTNIGSWMISIGAPLAGVGVPEPSTYLLFGLGALTVVIAYRRRVS